MVIGHAKIRKNFIRLHVSRRINRPGGPFCSLSGLGIGDYGIFFVGRGLRICGVEPVDLWDKASGFVGRNLRICGTGPPETAKPPVLSGGFSGQHRHAYGYEGDGQDTRCVVLPASVGLGSGEIHHRVAFNDADAVSDVVYIQLQA